jgi:hypothetical protein
VPARPGATPRARQGQLFRFRRQACFSHLIYPASVEGGLGTHVTLVGRMRFRPDADWIDAESYTVEPKHADSFHASVRTYFPALPDDSLVQTIAANRSEAHPQRRAGRGLPDRRTGRSWPAPSPKEIRRTAVVMAT